MLKVLCPILLSLYIFNSKHPIMGFSRMLIDIKIQRMILTKLSSILITNRYHLQGF